ncbi:hypothetical protein HDU81_007949, partial [Chytriomyces hyalinus]
MSVSGTSVFNGELTVPTPVNAGNPTTLEYTNGLSYLTAGTGLTLNLNVLTVNSSQTQITSVGTLSTLTVSGYTILPNTIDSTSSTTGSVTIAGGLGVAKSMNVGTNLSVTGTSVFTGA